MKLIIDTKEKTITSDENVTLKELTSELKKIFPDDYENYTLIFCVQNELAYAPYVPTIYPVTLQDPIIHPHTTWKTTP